LQPQARGLGQEGWRRCVVGAEHRIATQQLPRIALQAALQAVGKKPNRCERRHRQGDGHQQQAQLACPEVAPQGTRSELPHAGRHSGGL
jgi:hypothetical protein